MVSDKTAILQDKKFLEMAHQKGRISGILTLMTVIAYFGFLGLLAFNPRTLGEPFTRSVNIGIPFGISVIIWSWLLTGVYVRWANTSYDSMVGELKLKLELKEKATADKAASATASGDNSTGEEA
jgi:uncharacterized membrane protein (DUF485 family)